MALNKNTYYNFLEQDKYWQNIWEEKKLFQAENFSEKPKYYILDMFPYPSGQGLHVGHVLGYTFSDILVRYKKMQGFNVLHPMGWDAFGLPAEQYAINTGIPPWESIKTNIANFKSQLIKLGLSFDWTREINTTDEEYYKWTQWMFVNFFKHGIAYIDDLPVWWCPNLGTVLSNEEVVNGLSERGDHPVIKKKLIQWVLKIKNYADNLLDNLSELDWPYSTKKQQIEWIGKSVNKEKKTKFKIRNWLFSRQRYWGEPIPIVWIDSKSYEKLLLIKNSKVLELLPKEPVYKIQNKEKYYAIPIPYSNLPVKLPIIENYKEIINNKKGVNPLDKIDNWKYIYFNLETGNSIEFLNKKDINNNLNHYWVKAIRETNTMPQWAGSCWYFIRYLDPNNKNSIVSKDLLKYWGYPDLYIGGKEHSVLHLLYARFWNQALYDLGFVDKKEPFNKVIHQGLILGDKDFYIYKDKDNQYISNNNIDYSNKKNLIIEKINKDEVIKLNNDFYLKKNINIKVLMKHSKMSKSKGNIVNPETIIKNYGSDTLRMYIMFLGPIDEDKPWSTKGIKGIFRFLNRIWSFFNNNNIDYKNEIEINIINFINTNINLIQNYIEKFKINKAISQIMILFKFIEKNKIINFKILKKFIILISPLAPHIAEEIWSVFLFNKESIFKQKWPKIEIISEKDDTNYEIPIYINGKFKGITKINDKYSKDDILLQIKKDLIINKYLYNKNIIKLIYKPRIIFNIVVK